MSEMTLEGALATRQASKDEPVVRDEQLVKLVVFALGEAWFAFYGERISEILARADVFFVPGCPASFEGVINVRGDIESVFRPHALLHVADVGVEQGASILLGHGSEMRSGIRVDRVVDVIDVPAASIQAPPSTLSETMRSLALGVLSFERRPVTVLDIDKIFAAYANELG